MHALPSLLATTPAAVELDPLSLALGASGPVLVVLWLLMLAAVATWVIIVVKARQLRRWREAEAALDRALARRVGPARLAAIAREHPDAPGARVLAALCTCPREQELLAAIAERAVTAEQARLSSFTTTLSSIGAAAPFVGLLGTVYGIMDAFLRIGQEKSATLPVVAPAIGEALIATALGLFAAIPAVVAYNAIARQLDDLLAHLQAASREWVARVALEEE
ncbi:MAG: MotA/TolQ/ExbB proton channel family protein [Nannocystaceae bacterium]|nr:MotA/TolQ/ExbB proton channel family protein [Myxococcales bacterium]